ncbi:MAG: erythromycin esterase family protein [Pseudomonadota bacterium]
MSGQTLSPSLIDMVSASAHRLTGASGDYDALLALIGDARCVLIGEASHGTHEFYEQRARITQRLIAEKGFSGVAVEADWPDAYRVNRFVRAQGDDADPEAALGGFQRFPTWMWRNTAVADFIEWQRRHNDALASKAPRVGFYGLDLYSLFTSIGEVLRYLDQVDPVAARHARERYACFDHFRGNGQHYGYASGFGASPSCENEVIAQLLDLNYRAAGYMQRDGTDARDALFYAQQNARLVMDAERYYRTMFSGHISSWNLRDKHMASTLDALAVHLSTEREGPPAKIVVWAHNSHVGDARATEAGRSGEWTLGQLARERYKEHAFLIGLTTYEGTVTAASNWDAPGERKRVRPALANSYELLFHQTGIARFMLPLQGKTETSHALWKQGLERAIGVIYRPETERQSHYFHAHLSQQFDVVLHFDETRALEPLDLTNPWKLGEAPETFPVGV